VNFRLSPEKALQHYFDELLADDEPGLQPQGFEEPEFLSLAEPDRVDAAQQEKLQKLLQSAALAAPVLPVVEKVSTVTVTETVVDTTVDAIAATDVETQAETPLLVSETLVNLRQSLVVEPESLFAPAIPDVIAETPVVEQPAEIPEPVEGRWLENGRPAWAQGRFDVLLFQVSGLTLAVPLMSLGQIQPLTDELTPLFGQADWFMGLQPTPTGKIRTVNTAKFVMPERYDEAFLKTAKYVVSINGVPWGLAVDSVNQPITLKPDDVKWRTERSKRPWLAGTVKEHMCALLDTETIGRLLMAADKNARAH